MPHTHSQSKSQEQRWGTYGLEAIVGLCRCGPRSGWYGSASLQVISLHGRIMVYRYRNPFPEDKTSESATWISKRYVKTRH
jgi:hypothetical protein